ncbi:hypothetical protein G4B88_019186 [Cannabis sativa]|uniref:Uncharacterized protein n=1 Tax=Cannabis sativa TaxID=3483 RepID=A0A7J6HM95_CANSA|nr:hypothetical protein G4B88_019186 [Cannabis sativa]
MVGVMTTKRKYKSGALKRKEKSKKKVLLKKQVGSLNKYFGNNKVETSITNAIEDELECENNVNEVKDQVVNDKEEESQNVNENENENQKSDDLFRSSNLFFLKEPSGCIKVDDGEQIICRTCRPHRNMLKAKTFDLGNGLDKLQHMVPVQAASPQQLYRMYIVKPYSPASVNRYKTRNLVSAESHSFFLHNMLYVDAKQLLR